MGNMVIKCVYCKKLVDVKELKQYKVKEGDKEVYRYLCPHCNNVILTLEVSLEEEESESG